MLKFCENIAKFRRFILKKPFFYHFYHAFYHCFWAFNTLITKELRKK